MSTDLAAEVAQGYEALPHRDSDTVDAWVEEAPTARQREARRLYALGRTHGKDPKMRESRPPKVSRNACFVEPPREGWKNVPLRPPSEPSGVVEEPARRKRGWMALAAAGAGAVVALFGVIEIASRVLR